MRAALVLASVFGLAACHPEIATGTYACGPETSCPEGQACDQTTDLCVNLGSEHAFACGGDDREPDNDLATATVISGLTCVSTAHLLSSCIENMDTLDLATFATPAGCTASAVSVVLDFPDAYEPLQVSLTAADGTTVVATDAPCKSDMADDGRTSRCLVAPVDSTTTYALRVEPTGEGDCGGACAYNRYRLSVQLTTR